MKGQDIGERRLHISTLSFEAAKQPTSTINTLAANHNSNLHRQVGLHLSSNNFPQATTKATVTTTVKHVRTPTTGIAAPHQEHRKHHQEFNPSRLQGRRAALKNVCGECRWPIPRPAMFGTRPQEKVCRRRFTKAPTCYRGRNLAAICFPMDRVSPVSTPIPSSGPPVTFQRRVKHSDNIRASLA